MLAFEYVFSEEESAVKECGLWDEGLRVDVREQDCFACDDVKTAPLAAGMHAMQADTGFARLVLSLGVEDAWNDV